MFFYSLYSYELALEEARLAGLKAEQEEQQRQKQYVTIIAAQSNSNNENCFVIIQRTEGSQPSTKVTDERD